MNQFTISQMKKQQSKSSSSSSPQVQITTRRYQLLNELRQLTMDNRDKAKAALGINNKSHIKQPIQSLYEKEMRTTRSNKATSSPSSTTTTTNLKSTTTNRLNKPSKLQQPAAAKPTTIIHDRMGKATLRVQILVHVSRKVTHYQPKDIVKDLARKGIDVKVAYVRAVLRSAGIECGKKKLLPL